MMQTLYRTDVPETIINAGQPTDFAKAEYRQILLDHSGIAGSRLRVMQGWWNENQKKPILNQTILEVPFDTWQEGEAAYSAQVQSMKNDGFVHSFTLDPFAPDYRAYHNLSKDGA